MESTFSLPIEQVDFAPSLSLSLSFSVSDRFVLTKVKLEHGIEKIFPDPPKSLQSVCQSFTHYFLGRLLTIELEHQLLCKSDFQKQVLLELKNISYGSTITYGELAKRLNTHPRAIGQALKSNPLPLIYPCHRVVSKSGLGGFMGNKIGNSCDLKAALLALESKYCSSAN